MQSKLDSIVNHFQEFMYLRNRNFNWYKFTNQNLMLFFYLM